MIPREIRSILLAKRFRAIIFDVRGTIIHPSLDEPLSPEITQIIHLLINSGYTIALNTATSIQSLSNLVLEPLLRHPNLQSNNFTIQFTMYVDSATAAYSLMTEKQIMPLDNFQFISFEDNELEAVLRSMEVTVSRFGLTEVTHKVKAGQVNFYCGGRWINRKEIADFMNATMREGGFHRVVAMVPSAKETIDIAVCKKNRGVKDFLQRFNLLPEDIVVIGDSLQEGGPDFDMLMACPGALGIQVGQHNPPSDVYHISTLPETEAVYEVLKQIFSTRG